jgi:hypothetical protein
MLPIIINVDIICNVTNHYVYCFVFLLFRYLVMIYEISGRI